MIHIHVHEDDEHSAVDETALVDPEEPEYKEFAIGFCEGLAFALDRNALGDVTIELAGNGVGHRIFAQDTRETRVPTELIDQSERSDEMLSAD